LVGEIVRDLISGGKTAATTEPVTSPELALIVLVPWWSAVARPVALMDMFEGNEEAHWAVLVMSTTV
jgi:hypothetical protein